MEKNLIKQAKLAVNKIWTASCKGLVCQTVIKASKNFDFISTHRRWMKSISGRWKVFFIDKCSSYFPERSQACFVMWSVCFIEVLNNHVFQLRHFISEKSTLSLAVKLSTLNWMLMFLTNLHQCFSKY